MSGYSQVFESTLRSPSPARLAMSEHDQSLVSEGVSDDGLNVDRRGCPSAICAGRQRDDVARSPIVVVAGSGRRLPSKSGL
jgi:hypothetical protein